MTQIYLITVAASAVALFLSNASPAEGQKDKLIPGHIIACKFGYFDHIMLATSPTTVVSSGLSLSGGKKDGIIGGETYVTEDDYSVIKKRFTNCRDVTEYFDRRMAGVGITPKKDAVSRAVNSEKFLQDKIYYDLLGCNCEHWATHWRYGAPLSLQAGSVPNSKCLLASRYDARDLVLLHNKLKWTY